MEVIMWEICQKVELIEGFSTPKVYFDCLTYIQSLVDSGDFVFEAKDCKTDEVQDECGHWIDDIISHVIRCKNCGQCFSSTAITYRGGGSFRKGR